jgi:hypothetical protein
MKLALMALRAVPSPRRIAATAATLLGASALLLGTATAAGATSRASHHANPLPRFTVRAAALTPADAAATSTNWGGYAVTPPGGRVTAVTASFTVPRAGLILPGFAATWTGIGGYSTPDLIQAGVAEQSLPSTPIFGPQYYAWYELLPGNPIHLTGCMGDANCTVGPGDQVTVTILQVAGTTWTVRVTDAGRWLYSSNVTYSSSNSSAEWILEAPNLLGLQAPLAGVGTTHFGPTSTYTAAGVTSTIAQGNPIQIDQTAPLNLFKESTTSGLAADGQSFNVCAYASGCPNP